MLAPQCINRTVSQLFRLHPGRKQNLWQEQALQSCYAKKERQSGAGKRRRTEKITPQNGDQRGRLCRCFCPQHSKARTRGFHIRQQENENRSSHNSIPANRRKPWSNVCAGRRSTFRLRQQLGRRNGCLPVFCWVIQRSFIEDTPEKHHQRHRPNAKR